MTVAVIQRSFPGIGNTCQGCNVVLAPQISLRTIPVFLFTLFEDAVRLIHGVIIDMAYITKWDQLMDESQRSVIPQDDFFNWNIMPTGRDTGRHTSYIDLRISRQNIIATNEKSRILRPLEKFEVSVCGKDGFKTEASVIG